MESLIKTHVNISRYMIRYVKTRNFSRRNYCSVGRKDRDTKDGNCHIPVMKEEVCKYLNLKNGDTILDMTFGGGGHSKYLLEIYPNLKIIALDRDPTSHDFAKSLQEERPEQIVPLLGKFSELNELAEANNICVDSLDGVLFDLGTSAMQMETASRGFSVNQDGPLDMRMDGDRIPDSINAADVVNYAPENCLYKLFRIYGNENHAKLITRSIIQARYTYQKFKTTKDMANLVDLVISKPRFDKLQRRAHSATKVFQALRIFVNNELNEFNYGLLLSNKFLKPGGRVVVLSFHSLEDTIAKRHFQGHGYYDALLQVAPFKNQSWFQAEEVRALNKKLWNPINKKVITPTKEEVKQNPRSRSAKLRAAEKISSIL